MIEDNTHNEGVIPCNYGQFWTGHFGRCEVALGGGEPEDRKWLFLVIKTDIF